MSTKVASTYVEIVLKDKMTPALKKAGKTLDSTSKKATKTGTAVNGMGKNFAASFKKMAVAGGIATAAIIGIGVAANNLRKVGVTAARSELALEKLSGSAERAERWIDAIKDASMGTVTSGEAAAQAYQLMRFQLAKTSEEAQEFVRTVSIVAAANPALGGTSEAINQIQLTLSNMSFMRLDQLGISAGTVRARMKELMDETAGMTKETAFADAVMEELNVQADTLGDELLEMGNAADRMSTRFREAKEDIGLWISEGVEPAIEAVDDLITKINELGLTQVIIEGVMSSFQGGDAAANKALDDRFRMLTAGGLTGAAAQGVPRFLGTTANEQGQADPNFVPFRPSTPQAQRPDLQRPRFGLQGDTRDQAAAMVAMGALTAELEELNEEGIVILPTKFGTEGDTRIETQFGTGGDTRDQATVGALDGLSASIDVFSDVGVAALQGLTDELGGLAGPQAAKTDLSGLQAPDMSKIGGAGAGGPGGPTMGAVAQLEQDIIAADLAMGELAFSTSDLNAEMVELEKFGSLAEKFGLGEVDQFESDVLNKMTAALQGVDIEGTAAADAIQLYQLQIGAATGSSLVFDAELANLTKQLEEGKLGADGYVSAVANLSQADLSFADDLIGRMVGDGASIDAINTMVDKLAGMDTTGFSTEAVDAAAAKARDVLGGFGTDVKGDKREELLGLEDQVSVFLGTMTPVQTMMDEVRVLTGDFSRGFDRSVKSAEGVHQGLILMEGELIKINDDMLFSTDQMALMVDPAIADTILLQQNLALLSAEPTTVDIVIDWRSNPANGEEVTDIVLGVLQTRGIDVGGTE